MSFVKAFETYQIRWNIEVLNKEAKQYLGLGGYQGRDFDGQVADCMLPGIHCHGTGETLFRIRDDGEAICQHGERCEGSNLMEPHVGLHPKTA